MPPFSFSAHIGYLFTEVPLRERIAAARLAGFDAVEHPNPQSVSAAEWATLLRGEGMAFTQMAAATGDAARGEKGLAALPGREDDFRDSFRRALDYAETIGCPFVHPMAGVATGDLDLAARTYSANLAFAVEQSRWRPVTILIEAISETAVPGYFLSSLEKAVTMADGVEPSQISFLVDTYHAAISGADLKVFLSDHIDRVGHVHIADHPGRHEPGTGSLDFEAFLRRLASAGYRHAIGFEYIPSRHTDGTVSWLPAWKNLLRG